MDSARWMQATCHLHADVDVAWFAWLDNIEQELCAQHTLVGDAMEPYLGGSEGLVIKDMLLAALWQRHAPSTNHTDVQSFQLEPPEHSASAACKAAHVWCDNKSAAAPLPSEVAQAARPDPDDHEPLAGQLNLNTIVNHWSVRADGLRN
eukprot:541731-Amphidinium_carterae.1